MKKTKKVSAHSAESRQTAARIKKDGWHAALASKKVPEKYKSDIDVVAIEKNLDQSITLTQKIREIERDQSLQIKQKRVEIATQEKSIRDKYELLDRETREARDAEIENIRKNFAAAAAERKKSRQTELETLSVARAELNQVQEQKKKLMTDLSPVHEKLGNQIFELDAVVNAAFPRPIDEPIRKAILRGDILEIKKLLGK